MPDSQAVEVMIVEDSSEDLELTMRSLRKADLANQIHVARDGVEALDYLFGEGTFSGRPPGAQPRVILLDLKLPRVDGIEVLRRLKGHPRTRAVPVVVLTSSKEPNDLSECYRLGVNSYIVKPVTFEQFAQTVKELGMYWLVLNQPPPPGD
jgi:two-component system response regulator